MLRSIFWFKNVYSYEAFLQALLEFLKQLKNELRTSLYSVLFCLVLTFNLPFSLLSQNSTPTLWDSLEEPDIRDTSEFEYLFSKDTTQQKKKPLSETYEKKNKVKKVLPGYSNHNYITIFCPTWGFIMCCWFASPLFSKKCFGRFWVTDDIKEPIVWEICTYYFGHVVWIFKLFS